MDYLSLSRSLFYFCILLATTAHIIFAVMVSRIYDRVITAFHRSDECKIIQTEGETVRYDVWNALEKYEQTKKAAIPVIVFAIIMLGMLCASLYFKKEWFGYVPPFDKGIVPVYIAIGLLFVLVIIDLALVNALPTTIKNDNDDYKKSKSVIENALKTIDEAYPIYQQDQVPSENVYPGSVTRLYELILKRWSSFNSSDVTLEDSRNTIISRVKDGDYSILFRLIRFDSTLEDRSLIRDGYLNAYKKINDTDASVTDLDNAFDTIGYYKPKESYNKFNKTVKSYLIYAYIILFVFAMPLFHIAYRVVGPMAIGMFTVAMAISIAYVQFTM